MLGTLKQDLRSAIRLLKKSPGFTFIAILSLALGIGANTAIFTVINAVFLHPLPVEAPARLIEMSTRDTKTVDANVRFQLTGTSLPNYEDYRDQNTVLTGLAAVTFPIPLNWGGQAEPQQLQASLVSPNFFDVLGVKAYRDQNTVLTGLAAVTFPIPLNWGGQAEPQQLQASLVSPNFFDVLGVKAYRGRTFLPDEGKKIGADPVAVLSYSLWTQKFGSNPNIIGQNVTLNATSYTID